MQGRPWIRRSATSTFNRGRSVLKAQRLQWGSRENSHRIGGCHRDLLRHDHSGIRNLSSWQRRAPSLFNWSGANTVAGPVTLNGNCVIGGAPPTATPISLTWRGGGWHRQFDKDCGGPTVLGGGYSTPVTRRSRSTLALADEARCPIVRRITIDAGATLDVTGTFGGGLTSSADNSSKATAQ